MNTKEWLEDVAKKYGQEASDKCAAILDEADLGKQKAAKAAADRSRAVMQMYNAQFSAKPGVLAAMEALYDAGYRRFEIVENDACPD